MRHSGLNTTFLQLINSNYERKRDTYFNKIIQSVRKQTQKQANTNNKPQDRGGGSVLIVVIMCFLKCPISNKKYRTCRGRGKYNPYTRGKRQAIETTFESDQMSDLTKTLK